MNLENTTNLLTHNDKVAVSASGNSYWQVTEPQVTATERVAQVAVVTHKTLTHRTVIIAAVILATLAVSLASYVQISNFREKAYHAKLQRESRLVVL